jgi:hypothetical protein
MHALTRSMVRHAHAIAREVGARLILLAADVVEADDALAELIRDLGFPILLVSRRPGFLPPPGLEGLCVHVHVPDVALTRAGQVKVATLMAAVQGQVRPGDRVLWLAGVHGSNLLDTMLVLDLGRELELFSAGALEPLPQDVQPAVFERVLSLAAELGVEGREGHPVGTLFVVGDTEAVLAASRQLVINPFHGYPEAERNVLDPRLEETVKEFSAIDGAFVIRGDGVIASAARYLVPHDIHAEPLPPALGARHEAAAAITGATRAVAVCVSQSTGTVTIFRNGRILADLQKPRSQAFEAVR